MKAFKIDYMYWKEKNTKMIEEVNIDNTTFSKKNFEKFIYVKTKQRGLDIIKMTDKFYLQTEQNKLEFVIKRKQYWENWIPNDAELFYTADLNNLVLSHEDDSKMSWKEAKEKLMKHIRNSEKEIQNHIAILHSLKQ